MLKHEKQVSGGGMLSKESKFSTSTMVTVLHLFCPDSVQQLFPTQNKGTVGGGGVIGVGGWICGVA